MGSVINYIECPNCKQPNCFNDYYYNTGEEVTNCPDCGYYVSMFIKESSREKNLSDLVESDWDVVEILHPYGTGRARCKGAINWSEGTFKTKEDFLWMVENLSVEVEELIVSRFVDGKIIVTDVIRQRKLSKIIKSIKS